MLMLCIYLLCENAILYYLYIEVVQPALTRYIPKLLRKKHILLPNLNYNDIITSRGNQNFHLHLFIKGGASYLSYLCYLGSNGLGLKP